MFKNKSWLWSQSAQQRGAAWRPRYWNHPWHVTHHDSSTDCEWEPFAEWLRVVTIFTFGTSWGWEFLRMDKMGSSAGTWRFTRMCWYKTWGWSETVGFSHLLLPREWVFHLIASWLKQGWRLRWGKRGSGGVSSRALMYLAQVSV